MNGDVHWQHLKRIQSYRYLYDCWIVDYKWQTKEAIIFDKENT